jgi:hypothetical protein
VVFVVIPEVGRRRRRRCDDNDDDRRPQRGAGGRGVAIVLMFSKKTDDMKVFFFVLGVGVLGRVGQSLFFCNISMMIVFFGRARAGYKLQ